ncbi:MAG: bifunctional adenosylcobinamide kinase/adenosylcobinamide-phosphate guanylyltransferase [Deltaproteobacteria bacterium]|nr:bifunctional adenosylcobinamide kinase/adenosylcobinamide-phosphate guanylyltransferase [Deltaproteobacteria bacterium]
MGRIVLIGGGVRSGKSAFALARARRASPPRWYVATAEALDEEMRERARRHRAEREGELETVEEPLDLAAALERTRGASVVVIDCLTLWLANRLMRGEAAEETLARLEEVLERIAADQAEVLIVTNEVGMGVVPESVLGRAFRDLAGAAHQRVARVADEIHVAILGVVLRVHPGPVEVSARGREA